MNRSWPWYSLLSVLCNIFDGILNHVLLILNQSQKEMSITVAETQVLFESLGQVAHMKLDANSSAFHIETYMLPPSLRLGVYIVPAPLAF